MKGKQMKANIVLMTVMSLALVAVAAPKEKKNARPAPIKETTPIARIESAVRNQPGRGEGIFGEFWWANRFLSRHQQIEAQKGKTVDLVLVGDSIIHFWEWKHPASWKQLVGNRTVLNLGYGGDRTENVIWRLTHGELDGYQAKTIVLMIGTNNNSSSDTKPENVALGVQKCVELIRAKQPQAKLVLHPIFPRGRSAQSKHHVAAQRRNEQTNRLLRDWAATRKDITWVDFNAKLVDQSGWVPREIMADEIHPTDAGYRIWSDALAPVTGSATPATADKKASSDQAVKKTGKATTK